MKKIALMAMGLAGVLASCGTTTIPSDGVQQTNWVLQKDATFIDPISNQQRTIPAGTYIICDNYETRGAVEVQSGLGTTQVQLVAKGLVSGGTWESPVKITVDPAGERKTINFTFGERMAPLSIDSQGIVVNPKPVLNIKVDGYTNMGVRGYSSDGTLISAPDYSKFVFPVVRECQV